MRRKIAALFLPLFLPLFLMQPLRALAAEDTVFDIVTGDGTRVTQFAGDADVGDEYISGDNRHFRITRVDADAHTAYAEALGAFQLPDVSWLEEEAQAVAAQKKAVAMYCIHSDESYVPTDGTSSIDRRGGIYDVAESLKSALEKQGVTVYYSDENHAPHDAGAYRRSRSTAASLAEEGVDAIFDIHRDGIPDPEQYESQVNGQEVTKVRLLVGRGNQNAEANKQFAAQIKAVADKLYPGLVKDIYMGKGSYNQDLMSQAVLLEFGTHTSDKKDVLSSTAYMASVLNRALYGGVKGPAGEGQNSAEKNTGWTSVAWMIGLLLVGTFVYAYAATGNGREAMQKWKRNFQEMSGGALGGGGGKDGE